LRAFTRIYRIQLEESSKSIEDFGNFTEFFTRPLQPDIRPLDPDPNASISPVDGIIGKSGSIQDQTLFQAKGQKYTLEELIPDSQLSSLFKNGHYLTIYLSPRHYHRVHSPVSGAVRSLFYLPGTLYPVNPPSIACVPRLFARNERLLTHIESPLWGPVAVLMVGALIVGRIRVTYEHFATPFRKGGELLRHYEQSPFLERGAELGRFELGSTVILLWGDPNVDLQPLDEGTDIFLGKPIAKIASRKEEQNL
jgi:phosphatidylserine decarboxylase